TRVIIDGGKQKYAWVTLLPCAWLTIVTMSAGWEKIFSEDVKIGFLKHAQVVSNPIATGTLPAAIKTVADANRVVFNDYLDAGVAGFFMISVVVILGASIQEWYKCFAGKKKLVSSEVPFTAAMATGD